MTPRRGEIWWVKQPSDRRQAGDVSAARRPYLVVCSDSWNVVEEYPRITVCLLTGAENVPRRYDTDVFLRRRETDLSKDSVARCTELYTIFRSMMLERVGRIPQHRMVQVERPSGCIWLSKRSEFAAGKWVSSSLIHFYRAPATDRATTSSGAEYHRCTKRTLEIDMDAWPSCSEANKRGPRMTSAGL